MSQVCLICNNSCSGTKVVGSSRFTEYTKLNKTLCSMLADILDKPIPEQGLYSNALCKTCYKSCMTYDSMKNTVQNMKSSLLQQFKSSLPKHGMEYDTFPSKPAPKKQSTVPKNTIVLPASKLVPLPPNYTLNVGNLGLRTKILPNVTSSSNTAYNLKVTVGSSVLTQTVKTTASQPAINASLSPINSPNKITISTKKNSISTNKISISPNKISISPNKNSDENVEFAERFLEGAVLSKISVDDDDYEVKKESDGDDLENIDEQEQPMEIDEDLLAGQNATLLRVSSEDEELLEDNSEAIERESNNDDEKDTYFDVSILPIEDEGGETILGKLEILNNDEDADVEETIVMTGDDGSILRVMSGQKLVYHGGEITLVDDDDDSREPDNHDGDGHDSNDESQIELQVSGDEDTANAIIAAAQEQGGAFIKVESGEMFRVKSVQSAGPPAGVRGDLAAPPLVAEHNGQFKCLLCENSNKGTTKAPSIGDADQIMQHVKTQHDARVYICQICKKIMRKRSEYSTHLVDEHSSELSKMTSEKSKVHECSVCRKKYNSRTLLNEHRNIHTGVRPYSCAICQKSFTSKYTHQAHLKTHLERPRPFKCSQCPKTFFSQQNLNQHQKTHIATKDFICKVCGKAFSTLHNLEVHGVVHSGARPFVCDHCNKGFARRAELADHLRTHTGERPFRCEVCGAAFGQRSNLHSHRRATHYNDTRHACPHCPKRFKRRRLLDYHVKALHTGERPLTCEICHATFVYPEHYKKHTRIHSGEKPYVCEVCGKSFNSRDNRNMHRFVHSDKKPYECLVCGGGYMRKQQLYAHMNTSGHLAESIVVNQPRVQKISDTEATKDQADENSENTELKPNEKEGSSDASHNTKSMGKTTTVNLLQETEDPPLFTLIPSLEDTPKDALQTGVDEAMGQQVHMVTSDENGAIRLVQLHISRDVAGWTVR